MKYHYWPISDEGEVIERKMEQIYDAANIFTLNRQQGKLSFLDALELAKVAALCLSIENGEKEEYITEMEY